MAAPAAEPTLRITPAQLLKLMDAREFVTILDVRSSLAFARSNRRIRGDHRVNPDDLHLVPTLPKEQLTVAYCT